MSRLYGEKKFGLDDHLAFWTPSDLIFEDQEDYRGDDKCVFSDEK
jgi:hypothetical protein